MSDFYDAVSPVTGESYRPLDDLRFMGGATLLRAPLATTLEGLDIALVGVPTDHGVTFQPGARHGPREIRNRSNVVRRINVLTGVDPFSLCRIADVGDVRFDSIYHLDEVVGQIEALFTRLRAAGPVPLSAGGDHSITYPIMKALGTGRPLGMVQIDAHLDTWDAIGGSKYHHGAPFRRAVEAGVLDPERSIQIGIRGYQNFLDGFEFSMEHGMRVVKIDEFQRLGVEGVVAGSPPGGGRRPDLHHLRRGRDRPRLHAGHRNARDRRANHARSGRASARPARPQPRGGRRGGGRPAPRPQRGHGAGRRLADVRDPVPAR